MTNRYSTQEMNKIVRTGKNSGVLLTFSVWFLKKTKLKPLLCVSDYKYESVCVSTACQPRKPLNERDPPSHSNLASLLLKVREPAPPYESTEN